MCSQDVVELLAEIRWMPDLERVSVQGVAALDRVDECAALEAMIVVACDSLRRERIPRQHTHEHIESLCVESVGRR